MSSDLFAGTAWYYAHYRPGYPLPVLEKIRAAFQLDGSGRLLDLGCGTGELARALHADFAEVVALDISQDMLDEAVKQSQSARISNIRWLRQPAEDLSSELGQFRLVTIGNAFHWMKQKEVINRVYDLIKRGGVAILGNPGGIWAGEDAWERVVREVILRWLGPQRRTRTGTFNAQEGAEWHTLNQSSFINPVRTVHHWARTVDVDAILGELYSTSYANKILLGEHVSAFETDLRQALYALEPAGQFQQRLQTECLLGFKD